MHHPSNPSEQRPRWRLLDAAYATRLARIVGLLAAGLLLAAAAITDGWGDLAAGLAALAVGWVFLSIFVRAHRMAPDTKQWLLGLCLFAFGVRVAIAVLILHGPWDYRVFSEDQAGYDYLPRLILSSWSSDNPAPFRASMLETRRGYLTFVALQYYLFGQALIVPRIFNALGGALVVFYLVSLTARLFGSLEARIAGAWAALFPALLLWSAINLRDIWLTLGILIIVTHAFYLRDRFSLVSVLAIVSQLVWIQYNRSYLVFIMIAACVAVFALGRSTSLLRDAIAVLVLAGVLTALYQGMGLGREGFEWLDLDKLAEQRETLARADVGRSGYLADIDVRNPAVLVMSFPLLLAYFLYSPFPWQMAVVRRAVIAPEMIFWYWLTPFVLTAFRYVLREKATRQFALLMTVGVITIAFAVPTANMGLAYRYRAQIIPLFLTFAAAGFVRRRAPGLAGRPLE